MRYSVFLAAATALSPAALAAFSPQSAPTPGEVRAAVQAGVQLLVDDQEIYLDDPPVGTLSQSDLLTYQAEETLRLERIREWSKGFANEWPYEGVYRVGSTGHIPSGYRVGGTSIVCSLLVQAPGFANDVDRRDAVTRSVDFVLDTLATDPTMSAGPKVGYDVRGWGHTYALQFFLEALDQSAIVDPLRETQVRTAVQLLVDALDLNETAQGGWNYANDNNISPFMTGPTLIALYQARDMGFVVDPAVVDRALQSLEAARSNAVTYAYSGISSSTTPMPGSSARSSVAELALHLAGRSTDDQLRVAIEGFIRSWEFLLERKSQQGTHVGTYGIAPYYFFFGHTYAALAVERLPTAERPIWRSEIARLLWETRELDGGWNDRIFPRTKSYGTAMSLLALNAPRRPALSEW
jgi:hypothetical protein